MAADQHFRNFQFQNEIVKISQEMAIFHFGDSGKMAFEYLKPKITSVIRKQQKISFYNFRKCAEINQKIS